MGEKRFGDRKDGKLIRNIDPMHFIMPLIYPNRCDNEAFLSVSVDITKTREYLAEKNKNETVFPYTLFHVVVAAFIKTITLRPKMNRFIANKNMYQRNEVSAAFTVKKTFEDEGAEALAFVHAKDTDTLDSLHEYLFQQISACRSDKLDSSTESMDIFNKLPRFISKFAVWVITKLDKHGLVPSSLIETDPYYSSVVLSNIGSIKLKSGYHHLTNWGSCSIIALIGEAKKKPCFDDAGNAQMREMLDIGITIDERIADGYYYSKTVRLLKKLIENPELLELPAGEKIEY